MHGARTGEPGKYATHPGHGAMNKRRAHEIRPVVLTPRSTAKILRFRIGLSHFEIERPDLLCEMTVSKGTGANLLCERVNAEQLGRKWLLWVDLIVKHITPHVRFCASKCCVYIFTSFICVDFHLNEAFGRLRAAFSKPKSALAALLLE